MGRIRGFVIAFLLVAVVVPVSAQASTYTKTKHPIVVTNWTNEEGTRFAPAMLASGVFAGKHALDWAYDRVDAA